MFAAAHYIDDPFRPERRRCLAVVKPTAISALVPQTRAPVVALLNGKAIMRADWGRELRAGDSLAVIALPLGGGSGSNPLRLVAMIAVALVAPVIGNAIAGAAGLGSTTWFGISAGQVIGAGVGLAGAALVNALLPIAAPPSPAYSQGFQGAEQSPTYSLQASGNVARLGQAIPCIYGSMRVYPDYASQPYWLYDGNDDQWLYLVFSLGHGEFSVVDVRIEDTSVNSFAEVDWWKFDPGVTFSAFWPHVATAVEVSGQELLGTNEDGHDWVGPFICCPAGTLTGTIGVDIIAPAGLYQVSPTTGLYSSVTVSAQVQARTVNDIGQPTGGWVTLGSPSLTLNTVDPVRRSYSYSVTGGRYEVRIRRTNAASTETTKQDRIVWGGLRGSLGIPAVFDDVTTVGVRIRATNNLSADSARKINLLATRKLPAYTPGAGWGAAAPTRSIAWALADMLRADYGAALDDDQIDLDGLAALADIWGDRSEWFDGVFDTHSAFWGALQSVARAGRATPVFQGGRVRVIRDTEQTAVTALFTPANIVAGSLTVEYIMPSDETADGVTATFLDRATWLPTPVTESATGGTPDTIAEIELFGITDEAHARREARYTAKANVYRRKVIRFDSELEGFIPTFGDLIRIAHDMPAWGQWCQAVAWNEATLTLTVCEGVRWTPGATHYLGIRLRDGSMVGPIEVSEGATGAELVLAAAPGVPIYTTPGEESLLTFGPSDSWSEQARVISTAPRGSASITITAISEPVDSDGNSLVLWGGKKGLIGPDSLADYTSASASELETYAWIANDSGLMSDGAAGWTIGAEA